MSKLIRRLFGYLGIGLGAFALKADGHYFWDDLWSWRSLGLTLIALVVISASEDLLAGRK